MQQRYSGARLWGRLFGWLVLSLCLAPTAWAQQTLGTVSVTVVDSSGGVVPGAQLELTDLATNDVRTATAQEAGNYTFVVEAQDRTGGRHAVVVISMRVSPPAWPAATA